MGKTVLDSGSPSNFFLDQLHQAGLNDRDIDGSVADDAIGGPQVGICRTGQAKDGKVEKSEIFAVAFNNLVKHGDTIKRYFQKLGLREVEHLSPDGQFDAAYQESVKDELLGKDPHRSLSAWSNPKQLSKEDPAYAAALVKWASRNTRLPLLPYKQQVAVLKELGLEEGQVKGELGKLWRGQTLPKMMSHASVLRGEELLVEARAKRALGDEKEAGLMEQNAQRLFRTAVEMDGDNPSARRFFAEGLEAQGRFRDAGLHYSQALRTEPDFDRILQILDRLSGPNGNEMLGKFPDAFSLVGFSLKEAGRMPEAALIFHRAAEAATASGAHEKSLAFTEQELLAQEATKPFAMQFSAESNPVANALYGALRDAEIPSALIDGASGREGDLSDGKISAVEVFGYLDAHQNDARVQKALKKVGFKMPWLDAKGHLKKEFDTPDFTKLSLAGRMAQWHGDEAARAEKEGGDSLRVEKHLRLASYYEPDTVGRHQALGNFYLKTGDAPRAKEALLAAVAADPTRIELQLPLGKALAANGDFKGARAAYDTYLKANPSDAAVQLLRADAERGYQGNLRSDFDGEMLRFHALAQANPAEALKTLQNLESMAKELQSSESQEPLDRYQNLQRAAAFYEAVVNLETAHTSYDRDTIWKSQGELRDQMSHSAQAIRDSLKVPEGSSPTRAQVERAQAFLAIQLEEKSYTSLSGAGNDIQTIATLLQDIPSSEMDYESRLAAYDGLLASYGKLRTAYGKNFHDRDAKLSETMHDVSRQILDENFGGKDSPDRKLAQELVFRIVEDGDLKLLPFLSATGMKDYVAKSRAADQSFAEALKLSDVREKRGALLAAMSEFAQLHDEKRVESALSEIRGTVDDKMSDSDKLQIDTAAYLAVRGSALRQEKALLDSSKLLALKMSFLRDTSSPTADVQRLLLLKSFYDTVEDAAGAKKISSDLQGTRDALLNELRFGKASEGRKAPTDTKTRLELASLSVQIDQALLADDLAGGTGKLPIESRTALYTSRLQIWREELAKAKDLPYEERLEQARLLAQSASVYRGLSEGDGAFLDKSKVDAELSAIEKEVSPILAEYFAQDPEAPEAQKQLAGKITEDLQARFHSALQQGDTAWLAEGLSSASLLRFGEISQSAHVLMAKADTTRGPQAVELRLKAAAAFVELGLSDRVKESLAPVEEYAVKLGNPRQKAGLLLTVTQGYQQVGLKKEANAALQKVVDLGTGDAAPEVRELSTLARGMQQLNDGQLDKARETLAGISKNPTAQLLLAKLGEGTEQRRLRMTFDALAPVLFTIYQGRQSELSDQQTAEIRDKVQATLQRWQRQLASGELRSLDDAFRNELGGFYFESSEGSVTQGFIRRISNPDMTDQEFSRALLGFSRGMLRSEKYGAAMGIAQLLEKDPVLGAEAKAILDDIPGQARWDGILHSLKNMTIIFADSDEEALKSAAIMLVSFGVGRLLAVGAEAAWIARAATFIRSPIVMRASTFAVKTTAEAAGFTLGSMTMETLWTGKTSHWNLKHFGTEFGSMLVTFVLLHGVGMGMQGVSGASARYVGRAEAGMARALEGGGGMGAAAFELRLAKGMDAVAKSGITGWGTRILAFTGTEYVNEAIGLRPKENVPFWVRLAGSALMDAQMMLAGGTVNAISGGRISKIEQASQLKLAQHRMEYQAKELLPIVQRMGFDAESPAGRSVWQSLMSARVQGESLKSIEARTGAEEMAHYDKIVAEKLGLDPKSAEGRNAKAALLGYAQLHPYAAPGKPLRAAEIGEIAGKLNAQATKLLEDAGIERGDSFDALRGGLLSFALQTGLEPSQLGEYAAQAKNLKAPLKELANQVLGHDAARTPEGQALMGELAVYAMFRASSPEKLADPLKALSGVELGAEIQTELHSRAELLFGKSGVETPAGRAWMSKLFLRALHESGDAREILASLKSQQAGGDALVTLANIAGFSHPKQRLALAIWALENAIVPEVAQGMAQLVLQGRIELKVEHGRLAAVKIPEGEQAAKAKEVLDRLPELPSSLLREDHVATARAEEEIAPITDDMILSVESLVGEGKLGDRDLGIARFVPMTAIEAKADKIAKAAPNAERLGRYADYIMKKEGLSRPEAEAKAREWADQVILDARNKQLKQTQIYDTSLAPRPETQHLDKSTIDHHGRFGNPKNATEQLLDRLEVTLETMKADPEALKAAKSDKAAMKAAGGDPVVAAALRELHLRQVSTDNLADGGWCVWIAKNQARVLADPALRRLIGEATHFEDFTAFGTEYNPKDPGVRLQAALFQKYGEILKDNGIIGSDRFPPEKAELVMEQAVAAIDKMLADPAAREAAATEFFAKVESGREKASAEGLMAEASVHDGEINLSFFDLSKMGDFTVFQQWLALPRVEPNSGNPDSLQVSVVPMKATTASDGSSVPRTLQIVAIPNGRELPSGKGLLSALDRINAAEKAKAKELGIEPNLWFGKDNVILPNPAKGGTVLSTREVSSILTSAELGLFREETNVLPLKKPIEGEATVPGRKVPQKPSQESVTKVVKAPEKTGSEEATQPGKKLPAADDGEATAPGKKMPAAPLAARRGSVAKSSGEAPLSDIASTFSPKELAKLPKVEIFTGGETTKLSFEGGKVLALGVQGGKIVAGEKLKESLAEVEVMKDADGSAAYFLRRKGSSERQKLNRGDIVKLGNVEFTWRGETHPEKKAELSLVPSHEDKTEQTSPEDLTQSVIAPVKGLIPGVQQIGLSPVEIDAHAFLDFYFGEYNAIATVTKLAERSTGSDRDLYSDLAFDFRLSLQTLRGKVERYDALEKEFDAHRKAYFEAEGKDPTKAEESKSLAEAAINERKGLEVEIASDLARLKADPYNQLVLRYNERVERAEKDMLPFDFALAAAEVEATVAVRGTTDKPALFYEFVFKPMLEISESHFENDFKKLALKDFVRAEVNVTHWEAAERAMDQMIEEGVLRPDQKPNFDALRESGATEVSLTAQIPGKGEVPVLFRMDGKVAETAPKESKSSPSGGLQSTAAAVFLGITTLLTPEIAHAADKSTSDGSVVPWLLGAGATLVFAAGVTALGLWTKHRAQSKADGGIRQRRGTAMDRAPAVDPLVTYRSNAPPLPISPVTVPEFVPATAPSPSPVRGPVKMALADNAPGHGRKGSFGNALPTPDYGSFSVRTGEGIGYKKDHNEDGFVQGRNWGLVLDGMGGMGSGDKASEIAGKTFAEEMAKHGDMSKAMMVAGDAVNSSPYAGGGAVAVAHQIIQMSDGSFMARIVHVGDAGAIVFRKNSQGEFELVHRTEEQSVAAEARRGGYLRDTLQMRASDFANVVSGGLGVGRAAQPVTADIPLRDGDVILSFSDGVGDNVSRGELSQILKTSRSAEEVQGKIWELVHWKMQRLSLVKDIFSGRAQQGGSLREFVDAEGNTRKGVELDESPGFFIDKKGHVYDSNGNLVDHYKSDNVTIHAYVHDVAHAPSLPAVEKTVVMNPFANRASAPPEAVTQIIQIPQPWTTPQGEWILPKRFNSTTLGRDSSQGAKIQLGLPDISSRHAEFFESEGEVWLRDKGSRNGTWVNGVPVNGEEAQVLSSGDIVTFGSRSYQVDLLASGETRLTPAVMVSSRQNSFTLGPVSVYQVNPGVYVIRHQGGSDVLVSGQLLAADGNAYRIRNGETIQFDGKNYVFRQFD